jgi:hypothetical protein
MTNYSRSRSQVIPGYTISNYDKVVYYGDRTKLVKKQTNTVHSGSNHGPNGSVITLDENHGASYRRISQFDFTGDVGGDFDLTRKFVSWSPEYVSVHLEGDAPTLPPWWEVDDFAGHFSFPNGGSSETYPSSGASSNAHLAAMGTSAISNIKPTNNVANLATDLVEIRQEGLPHLTGVELWKGRTKIARAAGSEYLNQEFGWRPLVSDIRDASYAAANAHKILASYERNSHKMVRRRFDFPVERSEVWTKLLSNVRPNGGENCPLLRSKLPAGSCYKCTRTYKRTWFSGAFTYHLPLGYNSRNKLVSAAAKAGPLLGIELTPDVVWNATPWTWALGWVSNIGDVISVNSDMITDGLVIKYGYIMEHTVHSDTYYWYADNPKYNAIVNALPPKTVFVETKKRRRATPFGFEVTWNSFTPRQLAIAAALGLTRFL